MSCFGSHGQLSLHCFETVLQTMAEAVIIVDTSSTVRFCNTATETLTGRPQSEILGKPCAQLMVCACGPAPDCGLFTSGSLDSAECQLRTTRGDLIPVLRNGRLLREADGTVVGGVETLTDISLLKKTEKRLTELELRVGGVQGGGMVGRSRVMKQVSELIDLAAASNATVLITGETGTGKELAATAIHQRSQRVKGPLVKVNCSALPENLLESELFGHARGAFTGAIRDKIGRFGLADGGTLFLDEIGDVSPMIQVKLLRFLQEREFERVGESATRKSDVRIVAATSRDLWAMTRDGGFRDDLYYRLKVFPIHLAPLSERKEDIGMLVDHFLAKYNRETGKSITGLTHEAAVFLMDYCWPGNIRELENAIEHAFVTCRSGEIDIFDLPVEIRRVELGPRRCEPGKGSPALPVSAAPLMRSRDVTRERLVELLTQYRWNRNDVARALGVDRTTVWRKMRRFGIGE